MGSIESADAVALLHDLLPCSATGVSLDERIKGLDALLQGFDRVSRSGSGSGSETNVFKEQRTLLEEHSEILPGSGSGPSSPSTDTAAEDWFPAYMAVAPAKIESKKRIWELSDDGEKKEATEKFVQRVKDRAENHKTYRGFLDLVSSFEKHRDVEQVNDEAIELFQRQPELHIEFTNFLVDAVEARDKEGEKSRPVSEEVPAKKLKRTVEEKAPVAEENRAVVYEEDEGVCTDLVLAPPVCRIRA